MKLEDRIKGLVELGNWFRNVEESTFENLILNAQNQNNWFTKSNIQSAFKAWGAVLTEEKVQEWIKDYKLNPDLSKNIGLIMAGNLPLVGLHDLLTVLVSGHKAYIKYSSQDQVLMSTVVSQLIQSRPEFKERIVIVEQLKGIDAVIATGSDNSARYFKHYFSKYPHIIRQNRVSVGIISGDESTEELANLGNDIFQYYGLGCRNVAKIYVPEVYKLEEFISAQMTHEQAIEHHKYRNNYDYNKSIYLVNKEPHLDSGFFLMRESTDLVSPISVIYYERYKSEAELALKLSAHQDKIQCTVSKEAWYPNSLPIGTAQCPELWDYADGVDTLEFLQSV